MNIHKLVSSWLVSHQRQLCNRHTSITPYEYS